MTWLPSFSRYTWSTSPTKWRSEYCQRWLIAVVQVPFSWYEAAPKLGELIRATVQPWESAFGAEANRPSRVIPPLNTLTHLETRINILFNFCPSSLVHVVNFACACIIFC